MVQPESPKQSVNAHIAMSGLLFDTFDRMSDGLVVLDKDWRFAYVNNKAAQLLNREKSEDLISKHVWTEYPEAVGGGIYLAFYKALATQEPMSLEEYFKPRNRWFDIRIYPAPNGLTIYFTDISDHKRNEITLRETSEQLRIAINAANIGLWDWDLQTNKVYFSPEWKSQIGCEDHEISNDFSEWQNRVHPEDLASALQIVWDYIAKPYPNYQNEFRFRHKDSTYRWILAQANLLYDEQGKPTRMLGSHIDITPRKQMEEALRASEQRFSSIFQASPVATVLTHSPDNRFVDINEAMELLTGYSRDEILGRTSQDLNLYVNPQIRSLLIQESQGSRSYRNVEIQLRSKSGEIRDILLSTDSIELGSEKYTIAMAHDITERKRAQDALQDSEEKYRTFVEHASDGIFVADAQGHYVDVNTSGCLMLGYTRDEFLGMHLRDLIASENLATQPLRADRLNTETPLITERILKRKDGTRIPVEISGKVLPNGHLMGMVRDITERKQAQESLQRFNQRLTILRQIDRDIIAARSSRSIVSAVLQRLLQLISCQRANVTLIDEKASEVVVFAINTEAASLVVENMRVPFVHNQIFKILESGQPLLISDLQKLDQPVSDLMRQLVREEQRSLMSAPLMAQNRLIGSLNLTSKTPDFFNVDHQEIVQEVANQLAIALHQSHLADQLKQSKFELEQRVAERTIELQHSEARYRAVIEDQTDMVCRYLPGGILTFVNLTYCHSFNRIPEELLGASLFDLLPDEERSQLEARIASLSRQNPVTTIEIRDMTLDGQVRWVHWNERMLFDETGNFVEYQGVGRDITERKLAEYQLQQTLEQTMKVNELRSRYLSMAAHDLVGPLTIIRTSVDTIQLYSDRLSAERKQAKYDQIYSSINVMVRMLDDILIMGKAESGTLEFNPVPLNVLAFCESIVEEMKQSIPATHQIVFFNQRDCGSVLLDSRLLRHILTNLLSNAIKYSPDDTVISFTLDYHNDQISFCIQDRGIGIPQADQARLFEAFHRASNAKKVSGTGLGLAIVRQSVELHGGTITFESQESVGTIFTVILPTQL